MARGGRSRSRSRSRSRERRDRKRRDREREREEPRRTEAAGGGRGGGGPAPGGPGEGVGAGGGKVDYAALRESLNLKTGGDGEVSLSVEDTNDLRARLGLGPLNSATSASAAAEQQQAERNFALARACSPRWLTTSTLRRCSLNRLSAHWRGPGRGTRWPP